MVSLLSRLCSRLHILDPRDEPFVLLALQATAVLPPLAAALYLRFSGWLAAAYLALLFFVFIDRYTLMLHNVSHRSLFAPRRRWLNRYIPLVLGPFFGQSPGTYFAHHIGMHHVENNLEPDLSSTLPYRRDRLDHFLRYFLRFFFAGIFEVALYFRRTRRPRLFWQIVLGEASWWLAAALLLYRWPGPTLVVFVVPFVAIRFLMMAGNWGQHAFVDPARPGDAYGNSVTCINTRYNRRCFNDGYHIGHHIQPNLHWTELPLQFDLETCRRERAVVFDGLDFFAVWLLLMLRRYDVLERRCLTRNAVELRALTGAICP